MEQQEYNGWTNYETWLVWIWMDSDTKTQKFWTDKLNRLYVTLDDNSVYRLSRELEAWHNKQDPTPECGLYSDFVRAALNEVNWMEIAEHLLERNTQ